MKIRDIAKCGECIIFDLERTPSGGFKIRVKTVGAVSIDFLLDACCIENKAQYMIEALKRNTKQ